MGYIYNNLDFDQLETLSQEQLQIFWEAMDCNFQGRDYSWGDWEKLFTDLIWADGHSLFQTNHLNMLDQICDTKEHADIFFRCYPSPQHFEDSSYYISHNVEESMDPQIRMRGLDNWLLLKQKLNEVVSKYYRAKTWGKQKVPAKVFKDNFKCIELTEKQKSKTKFNLDELDLIIKNRSVYVNDQLIGHAKEIGSSYLPVGEEQHYDDEDMMYFYHDINVGFFVIKLYEPIDQLVKKLKDTTKDHMFINLTTHKEGKNYFVPRDSKVVLYMASAANKDGIYIKDLSQIKIDGDKIFIASKKEPKTYTKEYVPYHKPSRPGRYFTSY